MSSTSTSPPRTTWTVPSAVTCTPASGSLFPVGKTTVTCTAVDKAGNPASKTFTVWVQYAWSGFFSPLSKQTFLRGSSIPVKFALTGDSQGIKTAYARLFVKGPDGVEKLLGSFKYDPAIGQYVFIWNTTKGMTAGSYTLRADLGDGVLSRTVTITLK